MITNERLSFWATSYAKLGDADTMEKIEMAQELIYHRAKEAKITTILNDAESTASLWQKRCEIAEADLAELRKENEWHPVSEHTGRGRAVLVTDGVNVIETMWFPSVAELKGATHWRNLPKFTEGKQ